MAENIDRAAAATIHFFMRNGPFSLVELA